MVKGLSLGDKLSNYGKNKGDKYSFGLLYQNKLLTYSFTKKIIYRTGQQKTSSKKILEAFVIVLLKFVHRFIQRKS